MSKSKYTRTTVYVEAAKLKRAAETWAKEVRAKTGLPVAQPVSAYIRHLVTEDAKRRNR